MMNVLKKTGIRVLRSSIEIKGLHVISRMEGFIKIQVTD
jgi:hypothetical protein